MEPEPWRCRRTDGKKWRCSKKVVPDQKYCERHMHRGRQRSRKPVELSQTAASSDTALPKLSTSKPLNLKPMSPSANHIATISELNRDAGHGKDKGTEIMINNAISVTNNESKRNNLDIDGKGDDHNHVGSRTIGLGDNAIMGKSIGLSFSPNSVLQVIGSGSSMWYYKSKVEPEPGRCRRTDGKKWRCSKDVIPHQKYCERHMHRGAKKPITSASPNINLSISIPASLLRATNDEKVTTSSSGDTTITDASTENASLPL